MNKNAKTIPNEAQVLEAAKAMRVEGMCFKRIAKKLDVGVGAEWFRRRLIPGYGRKKDKRIANYRKRAETDRSISEVRIYSRPISDEELKRRREAMPPDDRDLTGRLMGDPPSWRSALGRRAEA